MCLNFMIVVSFIKLLVVLSEFLEPKHSNYDIIVIILHPVIDQMPTITS